VKDNSTISHDRAVVHINEVDVVVAEGATTLSFLLHPRLPAISCAKNASASDR